MDSNDTFDTIIIGAGPAGFTAAIYAARREMKALVVGKDIGGQVVWASEIGNYPAFKSINNFDLITKMQDQVASLGVKIENKEIKEITKQEDGTFKVCTEQDAWFAKTVIVAMGLSPRRLAIPGEEEFTGKGVSYCANCDGPFYRDKVVGVVGGGNAAFDAAEILSKIAKKVYLIHRNEDFKAFDMLIEEVKKKENIDMNMNCEVSEIVGEEKVSAIKVKNNQSGAEKQVEVDGLFIEIGRIAHTDLVGELVDRDKAMQVLVDEKCMTSMPGVFAAGDVTQVPFKQITIACGQATVAALAAYQYIQLKEGKKVGPILDRSTK